MLLRDSRTAMSRPERRRGQPRAPKARSEEHAHPFRRTASGFESLIPTDGGEDFFFSQWIQDAEIAAEFLEHGGEDRDALLGDPRSGMAVSAVFHVLFVVILLFQPNLRELLNLEQPDPQQVVEADKPEPLLVFVEEPRPEPPPVAAMPAVPVAPLPVNPNQPQPTPPPVRDNALLIPKAMLAPDRRAEIMNDLPFSTGETEEFYTDEEVKDPGTEGDLRTEPEELVAEQNSSPEAVTDDLVEEGEAQKDRDAIEPETKTADQRMDAAELSKFVFGERENEAASTTPEPSERERVARGPDLRRPDPRRGDVGEGGENGKLTDIRRFLAGSRFHNPEGGLVANSKNTLYYNDKGANFVPWIRRMLTEVSRTWRAGMPWAANIYAGHVAVQFRVARDGTLLSYDTVKPSGVPGFDNIAVGAIRAADLLPLPADYPDDQFEIILVFWYNERPYDIFG